MKTSKALLFTIMICSALLAFNACDAGGEIVGDSETTTNGSNSGGSGGGNNGGEEPAVETPAGLKATRGTLADAVGLTSL